MTDTNRREGITELCDYFQASWKTVQKHILAINDTSIYYKTIAGKHVLIVDAYEKKYGSPKRLPESATV